MLGSAIAISVAMSFNLRKKTPGIVAHEDTGAPIPETERTAQGDRETVSLRRSLSLSLALIQFEDEGLLDKLRYLRSTNLCRMESHSRQSSAHC